MLPIKLVNLIRIQSPIEFMVKYGRRPNHLLHIGAHLLEESEIYSCLGLPKVSWVEANTKLECVNLHRFPNANIRYRAVTDVDNSIVVLNLTTNSVSSSIFHIDPSSSFSEVTESESVEVLTESLDSVFKWASDSVGQRVDSILIDVQGAEGLIFKGECKSLSQIHMLAVEVSHRTFYVGAVEYVNIFKKLEASGLRRVTGFINPLTGHGDELWVSRNLPARLYRKLIVVGAFRDMLILLTRSYERLLLSKKNK